MYRLRAQLFTNCTPGSFTREMHYKMEDVGSGFRSVDGLRDDVLLSLTVSINDLPNTLHSIAHED